MKTKYAPLIAIGLAVAAMAQTNDADANTFIIAMSENEANVMDVDRFERPEKIAKRAAFAPFVYTD